MPPIPLSDAAATRALGAALASRLVAGDIVLLDGPLGAGKTTLTRGLVEGLGGDGQTVSSPTFTLLNRYTARLPIVHVDAYRLERAGELAGLGFHELCGDGIGLVEWADKVIDAFDPAACWRLRLEHTHDGRAVTITPPADRPGAAGGLGTTRTGDRSPHHMEPYIDRPGPGNPPMSTQSAATVTTDPPANRPAPAASPATGAVVTIPPDAQGRDPLVHDYLERFRTTCAYHLFSWPWLVIGVVVAVAGGWLGNRLAGPPGQPPFTDSVLVRALDANFGHPRAVLLGMAAAAAAFAALGAFVHRKRSSTAQEVWFGALAMALVYLLLHDKLVFISTVSAVLCSVYLLAITFRIAALLLGGNRGMRSAELPEPAGGWPLYTVLVPLYKERNVARNILQALAKLDYPRDRLDVKFLLEADDKDTLDALTAAGIPAWSEVVIVPLGQPKTKPRACNHGLARARGDLLVIFDAEDRPEPDQLKQAATAFQQVPQTVACLQAQLAYHNHRQNLLTRWFALEYNVWFRRYLSGLERLRVPIPLGGTSNHFRTAPLRQLGGWDPFNVTEDCDLGVRLRMAGHRTRILHSTTWEEANSRTGNWLRQRSRWLKGYLATHLVWFRKPLVTLVRLGPWATLGFFLSVFCVSALAALNLVLWTVTGAILISLACDAARGYDVWKLLSTRPEFYAADRSRWSFQMVYGGHGEDPFWANLSRIFFLVSVVLLLGNLAFVVINAAAGRRPGQRGLWFAAFVSPAYWVLISLAAWKGIWQLITRPHYWEKTVHGLDQPHGAEPAPAAVGATAAVETISTSKPTQGPGPG
jgi:tRNA threonylcarbamoyl adenosine modification protein YjeE